MDYQYLDEHFIRNMDKIVSLAGYGLARIQNDSPGGKKMQERKRFSYYAFISYKREDEKWAGWLQKQLETYRIPSIIRKQNLNVPKNLSGISG